MSWSSPRGRSPSRIIVVSISLLAVIPALAGGTAVGAPPPVAAAVIASVADEGTGVPVPIAGAPFSVDVSLVDDGGDPFLVKRDTEIALAVSGGTAALGGTTSGTVPRGESSTTISGVTYPEVENVTLCASGNRIEPGCAPLSVQKTAVAIAPSPQPFTISTCGPGDPSESNPICSEAVFHNGVASTGWFGAGACAGFEGIDPGDCRPVEASLFSLIVDLEGLYTKTDPLTVFWNCHRSECQTGTAGPTSGVPFRALFVQAEDGEPFVESPPCPAKGTIGPDQKFCTDYVQSKRSAGDLILPLLFEGDPRYRG